MAVWTMWPKALCQNFGRLVPVKSLDLVKLGHKVTLPSGLFLVCSWPFSQPFGPSTVEIDTAERELFRSSLALAQQGPEHLPPVEHAPKK